MSGRLTQLGRQLRKLRNIVGGEPSADPVTTLRRATQLACELACEHAGVDEAPAAFRALAERNLLDASLADRIVAWVAAHGTDVAHATALRDGELGGRAMQIGADLDQLLRSLESGAPAPTLPFTPLVTHDKTVRPDSVAAVTLAGRLLELEVRGGRATVSIDDTMVAMVSAEGDPMISFVLAAAPTSRPDVQHDPAGITRVVWSSEKVTLAIAADFARVQLA